MTTNERVWNSFLNRWLEECETEEQKLKIVDYMINKLNVYRKTIMGVEPSEYRCEHCGTVYTLKIPYCKVCQHRIIGKPERSTEYGMVND